MNDAENTGMLNQIKSSSRMWGVLAGAGVTAILVVAAIIYGVLFYERDVNFVIPSVPYHGYYNHFHDAPSSSVAATLSVAQFYGDDSLSIPQLMERMHRPPGVVYWKDEFVDDLRYFGFDVERLFKGDRETLSVLREYVNPETMQPVLVLMRYTDEQSGRYVNDWTVVIGIRDDADEVVLHDFYYGSSYVMSQSAFEEAARSIEMLVLTPPKGTPNSSGGGIAGGATLERLPVMDIAAPLLINRSIFFAYNPTTDVEGSLDTLKQIKESAAFETFHPAFKVVILQNMAIHYLGLNQPEQAIRLIENEALPINSAFSANYDGWRIAPGEAYPSLQEDRFASPYVILGNAYAAKGDTERARELYDEAFSFHPNYLKDIEFLQIESLYPTALDL